jgi:hypothetical protein
MRNAESGTVEHDDSIQRPHDLIGGTDSKSVMALESMGPRRSDGSPADSKVVKVCPIVFNSSMAAANLLPRRYQSTTNWMSI